MSFHAKNEPRGKRRAQVFMSGLLSTPIGGVKVTIRNVSPVGAHVVGERQIPAECRVQLQRGDVHVFAHVAWARGKRAELSFERTLTTAELERCMPVAVLRTMDLAED